VTTVLFAGGGTGGHLFPALALARAVAEQHPEWRLVFAGAERGVEARVLPERGLPHQLFPFEPIYRKQWWRNFKWPTLALRLVRGVDDLLDRERPDAVIGTGGYVSGPVVWRAARRDIPTGILELDVKPGFATRRLANQVREIWLATPEARQSFKAENQPKIVVTGAPIISPDPGRASAARERLSISTDLPVVVITGGSQGSLALNRVVASWLAAGGGAGIQLIWLTGYATHDQFANQHLPPAVQVIPFLDPMADAWAVATIAIARSGMMTVAELAAWGIPAILVPLPTAAADHQSHNAAAVAAAGAAIMIRQADFTADKLEAEIRRLLASPALIDTMRASAVSRGRPQAASEIASRIAILAGG
jgi:UDP-N-acetylglucosamine--N-acetylmuramyl-(pentapeptide) pyrophosphoryl-undecaprenol N-acetylglucosamine transferase